MRDDSDGLYSAILARRTAELDKAVAQRTNAERSLERAQFELAESERKGKGIPPPSHPIPPCDLFIVVCFSIT